ncbi:MAG: FAD-dependent oxidoreductase [Nitrospinota bacterium]
MSRILVLGAGFGGCTAAYKLRKTGHDVVVLEGAPVPGGGCWTRFYGGHPYTFGPRVFFSRDERIIEQLRSLVEIRQFYTRTWTYVAGDGQLYNYPLQKEDIPRMPERERIEAELSERRQPPGSVENFEDYWLKVVGPTLYGKFVDSYSKKMWGIESNQELSVSFDWVNKGTPIRDGDNRLYTDQFQGYPSNLDGYNPYFTKCLADCEFHPRCFIKRFDPKNMRVEVEGGEFRGDVVINTIYPDLLFDFCFGRLRFSGRTFLPFVLPVEQAMPDDVTWVHYSGDEAFTRITEFKKITGYESPHTLLGMEIPSEEGRYYPVQVKEEIERFKRYQELFPPHFYSIGRLGRFKYQGIPESIGDGIDVAEAIG